MFSTINNVYSTHNIELCALDGIACTLAFHLFEETKGTNIRHLYYIWCCVISLSEMILILAGTNLGIVFFLCKWDFPTQFLSFSNFLGPVIQWNRAVMNWKGGWGNILTLFSCEIQRSAGKLSRADSDGTFKCSLFRVKNHTNKNENSEDVGTGLLSVVFKVLSSLIVWQYALNSLSYNLMRPIFINETSQGTLALDNNKITVLYIYSPFILFTFT